MKRKGPDSLEGLFIAAIICMISTLMFGTMGLSSMLFVACITRYNTNRVDAAFPFMLSNVLQAITGPLAGYLAQRFSVRIVVFVGSILSFVGIGACYFAEDIMTVTILWGIVFGTGLGLSTLLLPVVINDYFIEQRSKALGMCYLGSPIGFFIFPPIFEMLMEKYGLSGTFLFLAGINSHCIPLAMMLRRPNFGLKDEKSSLNSDEDKTSYSSTDCQKPCEINQIDYDVTEKSEVDVSSRRFSVEVLWNPKNGQDAPRDGSRQCKLVLDKKSSSTLYPDSETSPCHDGTNNYENGEDLQCAKPNSVFKYHEYEQIGAKIQPRAPGSEILQHAQISKGDNCEKSSYSLDTGEMNKTEIHNSRCYDKLNWKANKLDHTSLSIPETPVLLKYEKKDGHSNVDEEKNAGTPPENSQSVDPKKTSILNLYMNPVFILICLINGLTNLNFGALSTVIIDFARDHHTDPDHDKYIMMCIALMGGIGMLGFGWVTDGGYMTRTRWASLTLVIGCVCTSVLPITSGFVTLIIPLAIWCVCQSSFTPLIPAITAEHIKGEFQEVAISACNVLSGPLYLIIPPLIGYFRDEKGSYDNIFYLLAGLSLVNSVSVFLIPYLSRWRDKT